MANVFFTGQAGDGFLSADAAGRAKMAAAFVQAAKADLTDTWDFGSGTLRCGTPSTTTDVANKDYVDSVAQGLTNKDAVRVATAAALPANTPSGNVLTADVNGSINSPGVDGVTDLALNDRVLVKDEGGGSDPWNGIYYVTVVGDAGTPWELTRAVDADESSDVTAGMYCFVAEGTANADTGFVLTTNDPITLNTTALAFTIFTRRAAFSGDLNGNVLTDTSGGNLELAAAASKDVDVKLGDAAGTNKLSIEDSTNTEVAYIDSDGGISGVNGAFSGTLGSTGAATLDTGANGSSFGGALTVGGNVTLTGGGTVTTTANGNITLDPNGTGEVVVSDTLLKIGEGADVDIDILANNGDVNLPALRYDSGTSAWQLSNDGTTFASIATSTDAFDGDLNGNVLTDTSGGNVEIATAAAKDVDIKLGDAAGTNKLSIEDSTAAEVAYIDSDGNISGTGLTLSGDVTLTNGGTIQVNAGAYDINLKMGDAAGAQAVNFLDSASSNVASVDSDGNIQADGDLTVDGVGSSSFAGSVGITSNLTFGAINQEDVTVNQITDDFILTFDVGAITTDPYFTYDDSEGRWRACPEDGTIQDIMLEGDSAGGDLTGTYPNPTLGSNVVDWGELASAIQNRLGAYDYRMDITNGTLGQTAFDLAHNDVGAGDNDHMVHVGGQLQSLNQYSFSAGTGAGGVDQIILVTGLEVANQDVQILYKRDASF